MRRIWPVLVVLSICLVSVVAVRAQVGPAPRLDTQAALPGAVSTKLPRIVVSDGQAHVAGNARRLDAAYWAAPADGAFGTPERLGAAEGQPDYSPAAIAVGPDETLYFAWINQAERTIYLRKRPADAAWTNPVAVVRGAAFPVNLALAAGPDAIVVAWRNPDQPFVVSRSTDGGTRWSAPQALGRAAGYNTPSLAAADQVTAIAYTRGEADQLQIYAGLWNGQTFDAQRITPLSASYADPGIAVASDGRVVAAWRGVADSGPASGVFLAERAADGSWPSVQLIPGKVIGPVTPAFDAAGGLHLYWIGEAGGVMRLWYAQQPRDGAWSAPVGAVVPGGALFNAHGAVGATASGVMYGQAVSELFVGDRLSAHTFRFVAGGMARPAATPILAGGATHSAAEHLELAFQQVRGAPTELRFRWDAPPTDADPWQAFGPTTIAAPSEAGISGCAERRLFTQVRSSTGLQEPAAVATITLDRAVQATVAAHNLDGMPGYTRTPTAWLTVDGAAECSGIVAARLSGELLPFDATAQRLLAIPLDLREGAHTLSLQLADSLGNARTYTTTVIYDATAPLLTAGEATLSADPRATVLQTIRVHELRYTDAGSGMPWALAVAAVAPTGTQGEWQTFPLAPHTIAPAADGTVFLNTEVSLAALLPGEPLRPGRYTLHIRLRDPAGNLSAAALTATTDLRTVTYPHLYLPALRR